MPRRIRVLRILPVSSRCRGGYWSLRIFFSFYLFTAFYWIRYQKQEKPGLFRIFTLKTARNAWLGPKSDFGLEWAWVDVTSESGAIKNPQKEINRDRIGLGWLGWDPASGKLPDLSWNGLIKLRKCSKRWNFAILSIRVLPEGPN